MIVECAKQDLNVVVSRDLVAIGERRMHSAMRLKCANAKVHGGWRVPYQHLGRISCFDSIVGRGLREAREQRRLLPHRLRQRAIDRRIRLDPRQLDVDLILATAIDENRSRTNSAPEIEAGNHGSKMGEFRGW